MFPAAKRLSRHPWGGVKLVDGAKTVRGKACSFCWTNPKRSRCGSWSVGRAIVHKEMRLPWLLPILVLLSLGCKGERQAAAVVQTPRQTDPRSELALARAKFEQNLIVQEQFETFDRIGSMSLGLPSSAAYYPFGESNRRFVLIQYEDHAKLLYQEIREDKPQTVWFGMMKQFAAPESSELHSLRKYFVDYGYRLTTSAIPEHVKKELIAKRGYASY